MLWNVELRKATGGFRDEELLKLCLKSQKNSPANP